MDFKKLRDLAGEAAARELDSIAALQNISASPLLLCIAGAFSTGKTSLLNRMLERELLPVALEESTGLPTFLEYAEEPGYKLVFENRTEPLRPDDFEKIIRTPPVGARFVDLSLSLNWLSGMRLVDLPGTGSADPVKEEYARQQMRAADAVVYLLPTSGPSPADLDNLGLLHSLGKKILLCVSKWDLAREAASRGEKLPTLEDWQKEIAYNTGFKGKIIPLDKFGVGLSDIFAFLVETRTSLSDLRQARINAELLPWLGNRLKEKKRALEALKLSSEQDVNDYTQKLLAEREQLLQLGSKAQNERQKDISGIMAEWKNGHAEAREQLATRLSALEADASDPEKFEKFKADGHELLENSLARVARLGRDLSENYGSLNVEAISGETANILLPPPPALGVSDFLESGRFGALHDELEKLKAQAEQYNEDEQQETPGQSSDRQEILSRIQAMERQRQEIINQPLPYLEVETAKSSGSGKALGRMIGEMADMALLFWMPASFASKSASYVARAAKTIGLGAKTSKKIAAAAKHTVRAAQTAHKAASGQNVMAPQIIEKLGILDKFTLGYWGEKLGEALDGAPNPPARILDQDSMQERDTALMAMETELQKLRLELFAIRDDRTDAKKTRQELQEKIARTEAQILHMKEKAEEACQLARRKAEQEYRQKFSFAKQRVINACLRSFDRQIENMGELLQELLRNWWEERIPALLASSEQSVNDLLEKIGEIPEKRHEQEKLLQNQINALEEALAALPGTVANQS